MSMKNTSISEVLELQDKQDVMSVTGTIKKVFEYKTGLGKDGGTAQNIVVQDGSGEVTFRVWDHEEITADQEGAEITAEATQHTKTKKWGGVSVEHYNGNRGLQIQLKVSGSANLFLGGEPVGRAQKGATVRPAAPQRPAPAPAARPAARPQQRQDPPPDDRPPHDDNDAPEAPAAPPVPKTKEELLAESKHFAKAALKGISRMRNAHMICMDAACRELEWAAKKYPGISFTGEDARAIATTFFIEGKGQGLFVHLPDNISVCDLLPSLSINPPQKPAATPTPPADGGADGQPTA